MADEAINYMKQLNAAAPDKPFFVYYVPGGSHSPHNPKKERVYLNTTGTCIVRDTAGKRRINIAKTGSDTTVVWNPWESGAQKIADLDPTEWHEYVAVETVNAAANAITLAPKATHSMRAHITVEDVTE
jgi:D-hexose-6-phosphate mutarotase